MTIPDFLDYALLSLLHALDHLLAGHTAIEVVGVGQQAAFERDFFDVAGQDVVVQQARDDLLGGQSFRNRQLMRHYATLDDGRDDIAQAGMGLELIFAGLEILARLERKYATEKDPGLVDYSVAQQYVGNIANAGAARDVDDFIRSERTWSIEALLAGHQRERRDHRDQNKQSDDRVTDDDKRIPRPLGAAAWRHFDRVVFDGGAWTARRQVFVRLASGNAVDQRLRHRRKKLAAATAGHGFACGPRHGRTRGRRRGAKTHGCGR